jgi:sensor histidine kinase YesM
MTTVSSSVSSPSHNTAGSSAERPRKLPLPGIFVAWTLWGVWSAQQSILAAILSGQSVPVRTSPLSLTIISASFWALITPLVMLVTRRIRDGIAATPSRMMVHVLVFLCVHVTDVTIYWLATNWLTPTARPFLPMLFSLVTFNALTYTVVAVVITALDSQESLRSRQTRESQLEAQLAMAQFHALRAQLHPHFLFNALNAVSSLIHSDPQRADRMLSRVSELLRTAIATASQPEIPLMDEMEFNRRYLDVERMRYGDRLDVRIDIAGETFDALVPNMLLQPLVENAVRHGIAPHAGNGRVEVRATRRGKQLYIVVRDTGTGFDIEQDESASIANGTGVFANENSESQSRGPRTGGVGLSTTRARLRKLYGDDQQLMLVNVEGGFEVQVTVPFHVRDRAVA